MPHLSFSANPDLNYWLIERVKRASESVTPGTRAKTEIALWRESLRTELRRTQWTVAELTYLTSLWGLSDMDDSLGTVLGSLSADADPKLAKSCGVEHKTLTARLTQLGPVQDHALREALTRWRIAEYDNDEAGWHLVGVRVAT